MRYAVIPPLVAALFVSAAAQAHIRLDAPKGRYNNDPQQNTKQKQGPCGVTNDMRTTNPDLIKTYDSGQSIMVEWTETINHPGHFRIAFSEKGQSFPAATVDPMPAGGQIIEDDITDDKSGGKFTHAITLPNVVCDNCTLQLIQVMSDSGDFYYQCADLILKAGGSGGAGGTAGTGGTSAGGKGGQGSGGKASAGAGGKATGGTLGAGGGSGGTGGALGSGGSGGTLSSTGGSPALPSGGRGGTPTATGGASSGGTKATGGTGPVATGGAVTAPATGGVSSPPASPSGESEDEGGCSVRTPRSGSALALLAIGSAAALLRKRRSKPSARRR